MTLDVNALNHPNEKRECMENDVLSKQNMEANGS